MYLPDIPDIHNNGDVNVQGKKVVFVLDSDSSIDDGDVSVNHTQVERKLVKY